eukprot:365584-Chlamydomonas_euryale.AAC.24
MLIAVLRYEYGAASPGSSTGATRPAGTACPAAAPPAAVRHATCGTQTCQTQRSRPQGWALSLGSVGRSGAATRRARHAGPGKPLVPDSRSCRQGRCHGTRGCARPAP